MLALAFAVPSANAAEAKVKLGQFGTSGALVGGVAAPRGLAVNLAGVGGAAVGDVYVADLTNNRIDVFSATGTPVSVFGLGVNQTTGGDVCTAISGNVCQAGTGSAAARSINAPFGVAIDQANGNVYVYGNNNKRVDVFSATGVFEGAFGWGVNAAAPEERLQFCTMATGCLAGASQSGPGGFLSATQAVRAMAVNPSNGNILVPDPGSLRIDEFSRSLNGSNEVTGVSFVRALGWDVIPTTVNEKQSVRLEPVGTVGGTFKLTFVGQETGPISATATAAEVKSALALLSSVGGEANVEVTLATGTAARVYTVEFKGTLAAANQPAMLANGTGLTPPGATVAVATLQDGATNSSFVESEICTTATGCKTGTAGGGGGQFSTTKPLGLSVDSSGYIYAVNLATEGSCNATTAFCRVEKFNPDGTFKENFGPASGECQLTNSTGTATSLEAIDVSVDLTDPAGHVFVAKKTGSTTEKVCELNSAGTEPVLSPPGGLTVGAAVASHAMASGTSGKVYVMNSGAVPLIILGPVPAPPAPPAPTITEITATSANLNGAVTVPSPGGEGFKTTYHFEYSADNGLNWTKAPIPDGSVGQVAGTFSVSQKVTGLQPNLTYRVRLVATTGPSSTSPEATFTTLTAPPSVSGTVAYPVEQTFVKLTGFVNPNNNPTTYHFEWGASAAYGNEIPGFELFAGSGGKAVKVSANLPGLNPGTTYHFRIVATNSAGTTNGADQSFTTLNEGGLPDGRAYELVSPPDKRPVGQVGNELAGQLLYQASSDGEKVLYSMKSGLPDSSAGGDLKYMAARSPSGWQSTQETAPALLPPIGGNSNTGKVLFESPSLSCAIVETFEPLTADTPQADVEAGMTNLYRRNAGGSYTLLTAPVPLNPSFEEAGGTFYYKGVLATDDCSHVVFQTNYTFPVSGSPSSGSHLYEWTAGALHLAGVRPDVSAVAAVAGGEAQGANHRGLVNALSADGSKLFFTATSNAGGDSGTRAVFVRKNGATTVDVSQKQGGASNDLRADYQMASADGKHVFFTANYGLTPSSSAGLSSCTAFQTTATSENGQGCDLYDFNVETGGLSDLSADTTDANGAGVAGVLDASDDGSYVYFAARGRLVPGLGNTEAQNLAGGGFYNVYLSHAGALSFVGSITRSDAQPAFASYFDVWAADATPDGRHLLFLSSTNVTGYESGGAPEAYVYSADSGQTACVSCRPDGLASLAPPLYAPIRSNGNSGHPQTAGVQHRPRSMSEDGSRIFFTMPDVLATGAVAGNENIYEWENGEVYLLATGTSSVERPQYIDSSASGSDVFITTVGRLAPQDFDFANDIYDVRASHAPGETVGFAAPSSPPAPCEPLGGGCQGPAGPQPGAGAPAASETASGDGNQAVAKPRRPHHKRRKHPRRHRSGGTRHTNSNGRAAR